MTAPIMGDAAEPTFREKQHLIFKRIRAQRPAMTEDYRLTAAPVLVVNVDVCAVFFTDGNVWHGNSPLRLGLQFILLVTRYWCGRVARMGKSMINPNSPPSRNASPNAPSPTRKNILAHHRLIASVPVRQPSR